MISDIGIKTIYAGVDPFPEPFGGQKLAGGQSLTPRRRSTLAERMCRVEVSSRIGSGLVTPGKV